MQEQQVTCGGQTYDLPKPFFVLATQNPIEQEGTLPAPRGPARPLHVHAFKVGYPTPAEELATAKLTTADIDPKIDRADIPGKEIIAMQHLD